MKRKFRCFKICFYLILLYLNIAAISAQSNELLGGKDFYNSKENRLFFNAMGNHLLKNALDLKLLYIERGETVPFIVEYLLQLIKKPKLGGLLSHIYYARNLFKYPYLLKKDNKLSFEIKSFYNLQRYHLINQALDFKLNHYILHPGVKVPFIIDYLSPHLKISPFKHQKLLNGKFLYNKDYNIDKDYIRLQKYILLKQALDFEYNQLMQPTKTQGAIGSYVVDYLLWSLKDKKLKRKGGLYPYNDNNSSLYSLERDSSYKESPRSLNKDNSFDNHRSSYEESNKRRDQQQYYQQHRSTNKKVIHDEQSRLVNNDYVPENMTNTAGQTSTVYKKHAEHHRQEHVKKVVEEN